MVRLFLVVAAPLAFALFLLLVVALFAAVHLQEWYAATMAWLAVNLAFIAWRIARAS